MFMSFLFNYNGNLSELLLSPDLSMEKDAPEFDSPVALPNFVKLKLEPLLILSVPAIFGGQLSLCISIWRKPLSLLSICETATLPEAISNEIEAGEGSSNKKDASRRTTSFSLEADMYHLASSVCCLVLNCGGRPCSWRDMVDITFLEKDD